jgi:hypothetical protein
MKKQLLLCVLAVLLGALLTLALTALGTATPVRADPGTRCVNATGTGCDPGTCGGGCYASLQAAVNAAANGNEIRVAGGTYAAGGTVAVITKELRVFGGYTPDLSGFDPDMYHTVLDAQWGGSVISITNAGDVMLMHLTLTHGDGTGNCYSTVGCGGGIYVQDSILHVGGCVITNNVGSTVGGGWGGGLYALDSDVEMWGSLIVSNTASTDPSTTYTAYGGGVNVSLSTGAHSASLRENQLLDNVGNVSAKGRGGGIYLSGLSNAEVVTNTIRGNRATTYNATSGWGGGLYIEDCSGVYVAGNRIENNVTHPNPSYGGYGGGVYIYGSDADLTRNTIVSNTTSQGGGVFIRSEQPVTLSNNLIARNGPYGGGVHVTEYYTPSFSRAILVNNTIADNGGTGVTVNYYGFVTLTNNIVAGHATGLNTPSPFSGTISATTNLFWNVLDPITGTNGIWQDPWLMGNYHPREGSPALDAGLTIPWLTTDLDGVPRPKNGVYDIGAFEGAWWEVFLPLVLR